MMNTLFRFLRASTRGRRAAYQALGVLAILSVIAAVYTARAEENSSLSLFIEMVFNTIAVLALLYVVLAAYKRWLQHSGRVRRRQLELIESLRLGPKQAVHLVRVGERCLLVGGSDMQVSLLAEVEAPSTMESDASPPFLDGLVAQMMARLNSYPHESMTAAAHLRGEEIEA